MKQLSFSDIIGKTLLIGLSYYNSENKLIRQRQYYGTVTVSNRTKILVRLGNGRMFRLPPDLSSTKVAPPGEYCLKSTGEVVIAPDYLTTWSIFMPKEK